MMNLFNKEKDFILKLTNLVLLLWLIVSMVLLYVSIVDLVMPKPLMAYDDYYLTSCVYNVDEDTDKVDNDACQTNYEKYKVDSNEYNYLEQRSLFRCIGSIVIVVSAIYLLNKEKPKAISKNKKGKKK